MRTSKKWNNNAESRIYKLIRTARASPALKKKGPSTKDWWVAIGFLNEIEMRRCNYKYRKFRKPTDVLSFSSIKAHKRLGYLGEIVICIPVLRSQAKERRLTPEMELNILLTHGLLHLLGFDHERSTQMAHEMVRFETKLLKAVTPKTWIKKTRGRCIQGLIERV